MRDENEVDLTELHIHFEDFAAGVSRQRGGR